MLKVTYLSIKIKMEQAKNPKKSKHKTNKNEINRSLITKNIIY